MSGESSLRGSSPEFCPEYDQQQHYRRLREARPARKQRSRIVRQKRLKLRSVVRIEIIQMADLPRFHYEVWADFDDGDAELLRNDYVLGLKNAMRLALAKWGNHRVELCRWHPCKHKPLLVISNGA